MKYAGLFAAQPKEFCGPVTRMEATTGTRVNLQFIKVVTQLFTNSAARVSAQVNSGVVGFPAASIPIRLCQNAEIAMKSICAAE